ncbi:MAG: SMP-30/gluconolactonase/LRE family protein [Spirochaetes bacterium]|nr:SMP-30/gluconolactonase/LRE family protein [Spirochaetota bacterium]MBU0956185.1 SMP-30/gluconolactonase/LRE family protein [Spirochaetota bacterium]
MKKVLILSGVIVGLIAALSAKTLADAGQFKRITAHSDYSFIRIDGLPGPEDISIDQDTGMAFISCDDRRASMAGREQQGAIYGLNLQIEGSQPLNLTADFTKAFHPHGISLFRTTAGELLLFAINHNEDSQYVEIFEYQNNRLQYRESISHPLLYSPNDLVAVGPRSFYATNSHGSTSVFGQLTEDLLQLSRAYVVYFDGNKLQIADSGFQYANGINVSRDGRQLYVSTTVGKSLHVYSRDPASGLLTAQKKIKLNSGADNIESGSDGSLYIACHPKLFTFLAHAQSSKNDSPSQVFKITLDKSYNYITEEIFLDDGSFFSGSSVAAAYGELLLLGQVFEDSILLGRRR